MNKRLYSIFAVLISLLMVNVVKAANIYDLDWQTPIVNENTAINGIDFNGGYLTVDYTSNGVMITNYNIRGQKIKDKNMGMEYIIEITPYGNEFYVLSESDDDTHIIRYDKDFNQLKRITIGSISNYYYFKSFGVSLLRVTADNVYYLDGTNRKIVKTDRNLENPVPSDINTTTIKEFEPMLYVMDELPDSFYDFNNTTAMALAKDSFVVGTRNIENCDLEAQQGTPSNCVVPRLYFFDANGNQKWFKQLSGYYKIIELKYIDGYIAAIAYKLSDEVMDLIIFDTKGTIVQTISSDQGWMNITDTEAGFMVTEGYCERFALAGVSVEESIMYRGNQDIIKSALNSKLKYIEQNDYPIDCCSLKKVEAGNCISSHKIYYLVRNIATSVTKGKGTVTVAKSSKPGEPVTFVVKPEPGYVLGEVRVTDTNGKVLIFKDYTFTMPNADVLVEAEFLPANPETKDIAIMVIAIAGITAIGIILLNYKKIKEIN